MEEENQMKQVHLNYGLLINKDITKLKNNFQLVAIFVVCLFQILNKRSEILKINGWKILLQKVNAMAITSTFLEKNMWKEKKCAYKK